MKKFKVLNCLSLLFNLAIIALVATGVALLTDIVGNLKNFTVLSNLVLALAALVCIPFNLKGLAKGEGLNKGALLFKFVGVASVVATAITTVSLLPKTTGETLPWLLGFEPLFLPNMFLHLVVPALALISFVCFDRAGKKAKFGATFLSIIPMVLYGVFYVLCVYMDLLKGPKDWYGLYALVNSNTGLFIAVLAGFIVATYLIGLLLWLINRALTKEAAPAEAKEQPKEEKVEEEPQGEAAPEEEPQEELEEEKAEEAPEAEEEEPEEKPEEVQPEEGEDVYVPVRDEEEEKAEEAPEEPKEEKKPATKKAPAKKAEEKKEEKPAKKAEEKKPAAKKPAPKAEAKKEEKKPATKAKAEEKKPAAKAEDKPAKVYHLTKRKEDGMWAITFVGGSKAVKLFKTKKEAEAALKVLTENQGATALIRNSKGAKAGKFASSIKAEDKDK